MRKIFLSLIILGLISFGTAVQAQNAKLPGNSLTNIKLQNDAADMVFSVAATKAGSCTRLEILSTQLITKPKYDKVENEKAFASTPWKEIWTVKACEKMIKIPIIFIPDETEHMTYFTVNREEITVETKSKK